jgi:hypothetical protein
MQVMMQKDANMIAIQEKLARATREGSSPESDGLQYYLGPYTNS